MRLPGERRHAPVDHLDSTLETAGPGEVSLPTSASENLRLDHEPVGTCKIEYRSARRLLLRFGLVALDSVAATPPWDFFMY